MIYIAILTKHLFGDLMRPIFYQFFFIRSVKILKFQFNSMMTSSAVVSYTEALQTKSS